MIRKVAAQFERPVVRRDEVILALGPYNRREPGEEVIEIPIRFRVDEKRPEPDRSLRARLRSLGRHGRLQEAGSF